VATPTTAQKSAKFIVPDKVSEIVLLFLKIPEFLYNRAVHKPRVVSVSKMSSICSAVPTEHRLVTDRQTDRQTQGHTIYRTGAALRGKKSKNFRACITAVSLDDFGDKIRRSCSDINQGLINRTTDSLVVKSETHQKFFQLASSIWFKLQSFSAF